MPCEIINIKNYQGKDYEYCGRGSIFGNNFEIGRDGTREEVIDKYKKAFDFLIKDERFVKELYKLKNRKLGCYCAPDLCHVSIIKDYVDNLSELSSNKFKLAVVGSRNWKNKERVFQILDKNIDRIEIIISGGAVGANSIANDWCRERGIPILVFYPKWYDKEGNFIKGGGFLRNKKIIEASDKVLAFQVDKSRGCQNSLDWAMKLGKPVKLIENDI